MSPELKEQWWGFDLQAAVAVRLGMAAKVLNVDGRVGENLYVVGWAKRGPSGVIGTNKSDAADVMNLLVAGMAEPKPTVELSSLITTNKVISQSHWESINAAEIAAGEPHGKPRIKAVSREELLRLGGL